MRLYSRDLVQRLERRVQVQRKNRKSAGRRDPAAPRSSRKFEFTRLRFVVPLLLGGIAASQSQPAFLLTMTAWGTALMLLRAAQLQEGLSGGGETLLFLQFPVKEAVVLRYVRDRVLGTSLWALADGLVPFSVLAYIAGTPQAWLSAISLALLLWFSICAGAIALLRLAPRFPFGTVAGFLLFGGYAAAMIFPRIRPLQPKELEAFYSVAAIITPPGWVCQIAERLIFDSGTSPLVPVTLLGALAVTAGAAWQRLQEDFRFWNVDRDVLLQENSSDETAEPHRGTIGTVGEELGKGELFAPAQWLSSGFIERAAARRLTRREATVAEFLLGAPAEWTGGYRVGCWAILITIALSYLAGLLYPQLRGWTFGIGLFIGFGAMMPAFGGAWSSFTLAPLGGKFCAVLSVWPVGLAEVRRVILKINLVRLLFGLPWVLLAAAAAAHLFDLPLARTLILAAAVWLIDLLLQPATLIFKYARGTNGTSSGCLFSAALAMWGTATLATAASAAVLSYLAGDGRANPPLLLLSYCALTALSFGGEALYRRAYSRGSFDLFSDRSE
jgi:hypothetical protein